MMNNKDHQTKYLVQLSGYIGYTQCSKASYPLISQSTKKEA